MPLKKVNINTTLTLKNNRTLALVWVPTCPNGTLAWVPNCLNGTLAWVPNCPNRDFSLGPELPKQGLYN